MAPGPVISDVSNCPFAFLKKHMAAFEEFRLLRRKLGHADDYP
jgi:hypothetical protein